MSDMEMWRFVQEKVPRRCGLKSAVLEFAARERNLPAERLDKIKMLVRFPAAVVPFVGLNGPDTSHVGRWFSQHRDRLRALLARSGFVVPRSMTFGTAEESAAAAYAEQLGWPVRITAAGSSSSWPDSRKADNAAEFQRSWGRASRRARQAREPRVLVEEYAAGESFEFFVVDDSVISVLQRPCARVVGDGRSTINELLERKAAERLANPYLREHPLSEALKVENPATGSRYELTDVLGDGERAVLRSGAGLCAGREIIEVSDNVDPHFEQLAVEVLKATPGLAYGSVSITAPSVKHGSFKSGSYVICGVDYSPNPLAHFPTHGSPRDIAGAIMDHYLRAPHWMVARQTSHQVVSA